MKRLAGTVAEDGETVDCPKPTLEVLRSDNHADAKIHVSPTIADRRFFVVNTSKHVKRNVGLQIYAWQKSNACLKIENEKWYSSFFKIQQINILLFGQTEIGVDGIVAQLANAEVD